MWERTGKQVALTCPSMNKQPSLPHAVPSLRTAPHHTIAHKSMFVNHPFSDLVLNRVHLNLFRPSISTPASC